MTPTRSVASAGKRRRPARGGYARGEETRGRIIAAALEVFAVRGFGGASTRMLAEKAGVTLPALHYYFDSKEGVYLACAEHIADRMRTHLGAAVGQIERMLTQQQLSPAQLSAALLGFLDQLTDLFLGEHELEKWVLFIIREQAQPTKAFDILFERMMRRVLDACAALVARLLDRTETDKEVAIRTLALIGQIVFFRTAREAALRLLSWENFEGQRRAAVKRALHDQIMIGLGAGRKSNRRSRS